MTDDDAHLRETAVASELVFDGRLLKVRRDIARLPTGELSGREYVLHPGAVMVVPVVDEDRVVVERQWRYPLSRSFIEFPAGKLDPGETALDCGRRELAEETGYRARWWARCTVVHNAIGYSNEGIEIWLARDLTPGPSKLDDGELLEVRIDTVASLDAQIARGAVSDVKTIVGLMWLQRWRDGSWPLQWQECAPWP